MNGFPESPRALSITSRRHDPSRSSPVSLDLSDAGKADDGIYLGCGRGQARGIGEVADDWCHPCGSQLAKASSVCDIAKT